MPVGGFIVDIGCSAKVMYAQLGCGLSCAALSLFSETSPLIGQQSAVQAKGMGFDVAR